MLTFFGATTQGLVRESNEDAFLIVSKNGSYPFLFTVADGIGGQNAGDFASNTAIEMLEEEFMKGRFFDKSPQESMEEFASVSMEINQKLLLISEEELEKQGMGTTVSAIFFYESCAVIAHIGDSSAFLIEKTLIKLTEDHTFVNELLKNNEISEDEAKVHPRRNVITRALGCGAAFDMDIKLIETKAQQIYILCTDGLFSNGASYDQILIPEMIINLSAKEITTNLINHADNSGGRDNTTVITIRT